VSIDIGKTRFLEKQMKFDVSIRPKLQNGNCSRGWLFRVAPGVRF
jgi:hypothetical protein